MHDVDPDAVRLVATVFGALLAGLFMVAPLWWWRVMETATPRMLALYYLAITVAVPGPLRAAWTRADADVWWTAAWFILAIAGGVAYYVVIGAFYLSHRFASWFAEDKGEKFRAALRRVPERARRVEERGWLWHAVPVWRFSLVSAIASLAIGGITWLVRPTGWGEDGVVVGMAVFWVLAVGFPAGFLEQLRVLAPGEWSGEGWCRWSPVHPAALAWMAMAAVATALVLMAVIFAAAAFHLYAAASVLALLITHPQRPRTAHPGEQGSVGAG